eukprot:10714009-Lingulodinium_polyedra.AAC.1
MAACRTPMGLNVGGAGTMPLANARRSPRRYSRGFATPPADDRPSGTPDRTQAFVAMLKSQTAAAS